MKFIDLNIPYQASREAFHAAIHRVLESGQYIQGPEVRELEERLAGFVGVKHGIAMASGTTALQVGMMALGIGPGDEVITTPFSFFATAETIMLLGAKPVFVDIDPKTYNINPALIEAAVTPKTRLIIPVSLYGQCADFDAIHEVAVKYHLPVLEDAAQSLGAEYKGRCSGGVTTLSATSFFPSKPLGCYGDGGACFTNDDDLAKKMRMIMNHGQSKRYEHVCVGMNGRLDSIQAAILLVKLTHFPEEIEKRQWVAGQYQQKFKGKLVTPYIEPFNKSVYAQYTVQVDQRAAVQNYLQEKGIPTMVHYPAPLHKQPIFSSSEIASVSCPVAEQVAQRVISLPFYPDLPEAQLAQIVECLLEAVENIETVEE